MALLPLSGTASYAINRLFSSNFKLQTPNFKLSFPALPSRGPVPVTGFERGSLQTPRSSRLGLAASFEGVSVNIIYMPMLTPCFDTYGNRIILPVYIVFLVKYTHHFYFQMNHQIRSCPVSMGKTVRMLFPALCTSATVGNLRLRIHESCCCKESSSVFTMLTYSYQLVSKIV